PGARAGAPGRAAARRRRPGDGAHLGAGRGGGSGAAPPASPPRRGTRRLPHDQRGGVLVARVRARRPGAGGGGGGGRADHDRRARGARAAAGLLGARQHPPGGARRAAAAVVAGGARRVSGWGVGPAALQSVTFPTASNDMPNGGRSRRSTRSSGTSRSLTRAWRPGTLRRLSTRAFRYQAGTPRTLK